MSKSLEELTNKIKKAIPEIEELKFGCHILLNGFSDVEKSIITTVSLSLINTIDYIVDAEDNWWCDGQYKYEDIREILGRPITVLDFLMASSKIDSNRPLALSEDGEVMFYLESSSDIIWPLTLTLNQLDEKTVVELNKLI